MKKHVLYWLAVVLIVIIGCQKELSFELGNTPAEGSLQSDVSGDCLPKTINGTYVATTPLVPITNSITISVNVTRTGTYIITTDTINGYFFRATGTFTALGATNVTLRGNGTPFAAGIDNFVVSFNGTICDIAVTVLPAGSTPAVFTLVNGGTPANCASAVVFGTYLKDIAVTASEYVDIVVNVTQLGPYTIRASGGGMVFQSATGSFSILGNNTVRLLATGIPTVAGANTITFDAPFASCSFTVTVAGPAVYTINCPGVTVQGTYQVGVALTAANTITIPVTVVTTPGSYLFNVSINGMTFTGSGTISPPLNIIATEAGTPSAAASPTSNLVLTSPSSCTIPITVAAAAGPAVYTINCAGVTVQGTYQVGVALTAANTITIPVTAVTTPGSYLYNVSVNGMTFTGSGTISTPGNIILTGTGTPSALASPISNLVITSPSSCTIPITVAAAPVIDWSFMIGATTYSGATSDVIGLDITSFPPFRIVDYYGEYGGTPDLFNITLGDPAGGVLTAGETYNSNFTTLVNGAYFYFDGGATLELEATDPTTTPGVNIIFTITSHTVATKTIIGTFSGTAFDYVSSTIKTITNGTFKIVYPN